MTAGNPRTYDAGGELPPSPRRRTAVAVHMVDPWRVAVLCGTSRNWRGTNDPQQVTCRACLRVLQHRTRRAKEEQATATK